MTHLPRSFLTHLSYPTRDPSPNPRPHLPPPYLSIPPPQLVGRKPYNRCSRDGNVFPRVNLLFLLGAKSGEFVFILMELSPCTCSLFQAFFRCVMDSFFLRFRFTLVFIVGIIIVSFGRRLSERELPLRATDRNDVDVIAEKHGRTQSSSIHIRAFATTWQRTPPPYPSSVGSECQRQVRGAGGGGGGRGTS